jgi:hypothetical protein
MRSHILKESSGGERETQRKKWLEVELEIYSCGLDEIYLKLQSFLAFLRRKEEEENEPLRKRYYHEEDRRLNNN